MPLENRKMFQVLSFMKAFCIVRNQKELESLLKALKILDVGIIIGSGLEESKLLLEFAQLLHEFLGKNHKYLVSQSNSDCPLNPVEQHPPDIIECIKASPTTSDICDIDLVSQPSVELFWTKYFHLHRPAKLTECIDHWPAISKWRDLNYFMNTAGYRTVPIELGKKYDHDDWSQGMYRFGDFLKEFMTQTRECTQSAYLAQHDLFDQIPKLKRDIIVPDYCAISSQDPVIKSWIGPENTISTMHTDDKHNFLCQVMGEKLVIIASPNEAENLYLYDGLLNNTSQVDPENLDFTEFPLSKTVKFQKLILHPGEMLYLPKLWFHYVRSLTSSISVSFWFDVDDNTEK